VICLACSALIASVFVMKRLGTEFIPIMDEGAFDMDVQLLPGISLAKALDITNLVQKKLQAFPNNDGNFADGTNRHRTRGQRRGQNGFTGIFKPRSEWKTATDRDEMTEKMRNALADIRVWHSASVSPYNAVSTSLWRERERS